MSLSLHRHQKMNNSNRDTYTNEKNFTTLMMTMATTTTTTDINNHHDSNDCSHHSLIRTTRRRRIGIDGIINNGTSSTAMKTAWAARTSPALMFLLFVTTAAIFINNNYTTMMTTTTTRISSYAAVVDATPTPAVSAAQKKSYDPLQLQRQILLTTTRGGDGGGGWFGQTTAATTATKKKTSSSRSSIARKSSNEKGSKKSSFSATAAAAAAKQKKSTSEFVRTASSIGSKFVDRIYHDWWFGHVPEIFRFCFTGSLANVFFLWLEHLLFVWATESSTATLILTSGFDIEEEHAATLSYTLAYLLQIISTHMLNALLVYGLSTIDTFSKYITTLRRQFYAYSTGMVLSVMLFGYLTSTSRPHWLQWMDRRTALWTTTFIIAGVNYVVIGKIMKEDPSPPPSSSTQASRRT